MSKAGDRIDLARARWLEARRHAEEAAEVSRIAVNIAFQRYADYAEIEQPGFADFFRRVLTRLPTHEDKGEREQ